MAGLAGIRMYDEQWSARMRRMAGNLQPFWEPANAWGLAVQIENQIVNLDIREFTVRPVFMPDQKKLEIWATDFPLKEIVFAPPFPTIKYIRHMGDMVYGMPVKKVPEGVERVRLDYAFVSKEPIVIVEMSSPQRISDYQKRMAQRGRARGRE